MKNKNPYELDQVAIRMVEMPPLYSDTPLTNSDKVVKLLAETFKDCDREVCAVINFRTDLTPINLNIVSMGALNETTAHPREMLKSAILSNAYGMMIVHNHVSGKLEPSREDIMMTDRISQICRLMGFNFIDHIILGHGKDYFSFNRKGIMPVSDMKLATRLEDIELNPKKEEQEMKMAEATRYEQKQIVSFTVAECSEFHNMGEFHENITTIKEAIEKFKQIPFERMNGIPSIGIRVAEADKLEDFTELDVLVGNRIDMDMIGYVPEIGNNKKAQYAVAEMLHEFKNTEIIGTIPKDIKKKVQVIESKGKAADQLKEVTDKLEQGVQEVFQSDSYKKLLHVMAKMPQYSINNHILIAMQTQGKASMCQSFTGWKQIGRFVKAGEKGIKIIAPTPYTIQKEIEKLDSKGKLVKDADGEPVRETKEITLNAFRIAYTFDISQTDGKEIPTLGVDELVGNIKGYPTLMKAIQETCPVPITFETITDGAKGFYHQTEKRIAIQEGMSEVQNVKTAIHEMAHQKLHAKELTTGMPSKSRNGKEVEAESVAFVVCEHYGINTSDYSFGYVAGWSNGKDTPELKASLQTIRDASSELITAIDTKVAELTKGKEIEKTVTKKQSVKEKLEAGKEKIAKTPARKQKSKGVEIV